MPTLRGRAGNGVIRSGSHDNNIETRIGRHVQPQPNGCWLYNGHTDRYGNTEFWIDGVERKIIVHRYVYELLVGKIPDGHHVHHECENPGCCNPAHLIALSPKEHKQRHAEMNSGG